MIRIPILVVLIIYSALCSGQENHLSSDKKIRTKLFVAGGRSLFSTNVHKSQTKYPTSEYRLGISFYCRLSKAFEFQVRPVIGIKTKGKVQNVLSPFNYLEESTKINYGFSEISILMNYHLGKKMVIKSGLNSRFFLPSNNVQYGFLGSKFDIGALLGVSVRLSSRVSIGSEYIFGLTNVLHLSYYDSNLQPQNGVLSIRNQVGQITIEYSLRKVNQ